MDLNARRLILLKAEERQLAVSREEVRELSLNVAGLRAVIVQSNAPHSNILKKNLKAKPSTQLFGFGRASANYLPSHQFVQMVLKER